MKSINFTYHSFKSVISIYSTGSKQTALLSALWYIQGIQHQDMVIILGQCDNVAFRCDLQTAAPAHLDIRALELPYQRAVPLEHGHMKPVTVTVTNQHISRIADIYAIWIVGDVLAANTALEQSLLIKYHNTVTLEK